MGGPWGELRQRFLGGISGSVSLTQTMSCHPRKEGEVVIQVTQKQVSPRPAQKSSWETWILSPRSAALKETLCGLSHFHLGFTWKLQALPSEAERVEDGGPLDSSSSVEPTLEPRLPIPPRRI